MKSQKCPFCALIYVNIPGCVMFAINAKLHNMREWYRVRNHIHMMCYGTLECISVLSKANCWYSAKHYIWWLILKPSLGRQCAQLMTMLHLLLFGFLCFCGTRAAAPDSLRLVHVVRLIYWPLKTRPQFYQTRSAWSMDQGSTKKRSAVHNFVSTVTKFCVMWEGLSLPHDTKFSNCRGAIVDRRVIFIWSLIHGSSWSGLIKVRPGVFVMPTLLLLASMQVVVITTSDVTSADRAEFMNSSVSVYLTRKVISLVHLL